MPFLPASNIFALDPDEIKERMKGLDNYMKVREGKKEVKGIAVDISITTWHSGDRYFQIIHIRKKEK